MNALDCSPPNEGSELDPQLAIVTYSPPTPIDQHSAQTSLTPISPSTTSPQSPTSPEMIKFDTEGLYSTSSVLNPSRFVKVFRMGSKPYSIFIILAVALVVHLLLWVAVGMLDMWVLSRTLMSEGSSMFSLHGCVLTISLSSFVFVESGLYIVVEVIVVILCLMSDRDTWGTKRETLIVILVQFVCIVAFVVCSFVQFVKTTMDYIVPYGNALVVYSIFEVFVCIVLPIVYAARSDWKSASMMEGRSDLELFLFDKDMFNPLLDFGKLNTATFSSHIFCFSRRFQTCCNVKALCSYCPETFSFGETL